MNNLKMCILASGSKGNSVLIISPNTKILIDLGISATHATNLLTELMIDPNEINGILITHTHSDHIAGLKVFIKKYHSTLYLTKKMLNDLNKQFLVENYVLIDDDFSIGDLFINVIRTSHDVSESNGYIVEYHDKSIVYITDTGYIKSNYFDKLKNRNIYIMESNHDIQKLMDGNYPYYLKQRILSDSGHLSNKDSAFYLSKFIGNKTKVVFLAHLSEENNDPDLAISTLKQTLDRHHIQFNDIKIARQNQKSEMVEL